MDETTATPVTPVVQAFDGKKTYTLAAVAALSALISYLTGAVSMADAIQIALIGGVAATLRHSIAKATGSSVIADAVVDAVNIVVAREAQKDDTLPKQ